MKIVKDKLIKVINRISRIESTHHSIALSFSTGTFIAILPTPGFSFFFGFLVAVIFKNVNKLALFVALIVFNPLVNLPFNVASFALGDMIFRNVPVREFDLVFLNQAYHFTRRFLVGSLVVAASMSIFSYFAIRVLVNRVKYWTSLKK